MQQQQNLNSYFEGMSISRQQPLASRMMPNGDHLGFSHGAFHSNQPSIGGYADRHPQRTNLQPINMNHLNQTPVKANDIQTPGTGFDLNYTPLLPSQLLLGSPFQTGSSSNFASPQFQNFPTFSPQNGSQQLQGLTNQVRSPLSNSESTLSPQLYQRLASPPAPGGPQLFYGPQARNDAFVNMTAPNYVNYGPSMHMTPGLLSGTSRTVYLGNIPPETSAEEILSHVRSGQIESVRLLPDKNCAFISFLDSSSATHFHSDAILKKLSIRGQEIKIGWGKPSQVPTSVALAVQQSGASRNVYLGNLGEDVTEDELREELGKFGSIDTVKIVREKAIGFVHFLSIGNAIKAVAQLPQEPKWQPPRRVFYGKDRCAYVSKTQQQNAAQYLGIAPGYAHMLNGADRDVISNALAQQSFAAAAVATSAGGLSNVGNRTVYLGNIHPETTVEEICNVVRGGLLHHIRYIPDKHICFVTFIDPTSAASFYALSNLQGLMIHNRRLKIGWGKHSGGLPPAIALAVSGGASRNVYVGNLDEAWSEERLRQDFSEYGEIELVNTLREKSCAFVNFTNIANAIKAIEAVRGREEYKRFKINFGKDRCGNPPRHVNNYNQFQQPGQQGFAAMQEDQMSPPPSQAFGAAELYGRQSGAISPPNSGHSGPMGMSNGAQHAQMHGSNASTMLNNNPLNMYLHQLSAQQNQEQRNQDVLSFGPPSQGSMSGQQGGFLYGGGFGGDESMRSSPLGRQQASHGSSNSFSVNVNGMTSGAVTVGGLLAPSNLNARMQHARTLSLPVFPQQNGQQQHPHQPHHGHGLGSFSGLGGFGADGYGLAIQEEESGVQ